MKTCKRCLIEKPISDFHPYRRGSKSLRPWCKECTRSVNNRRARHKRNSEGMAVRRYSFKRETFHQHKTFPASVSNLDRKDDWLRRRYGISIRTYNDLLQQQGGVCAICGRGPGRRSLHVDHNHTTGKIRALLCGPCNSALGNVGDRIDLLYALIDYLKKHARDEGSPSTFIPLSGAVPTLHAYGWIRMRVG